mgnify:CR=1 FL=1
MTAAEKITDSRQARSDATKNALMRAAEKLIAERGIGNVSISDIVAAAAQKNQSALQYHFTNIDGLIEAILENRSSETHHRRAELIKTLLARDTQPNLRDICMLMVQPAFLLAQESIEYQNYVKAFGHQLVLSERSLLPLVQRRGGGGASGQKTSELLKAALPQLTPAHYQQRMEAAVRLCSASMYYQARQPKGFKGDQAERFLHGLVDALVGLMSGPISEQSKAAAKKQG